MTTTHIEPSIELAKTDKELLLHILGLARREAEVTIAMDHGFDVDYTDDLLCTYEGAIQWLEENTVTSGAIVDRFLYEISAAFDTLLDAEAVSALDDTPELPRISDPKNRSSEHTTDLIMLNHLTTLARRDAEVGLGLEYGCAGDYRDDLVDAYNDAVDWFNGNDVSIGLIWEVLGSEIDNAGETLRESDGEDDDEN